MTKKLFIVTAVDTSETADGKARVLDICKTREEALNVIKNDMESYVNDAAGMEVISDFDKWSAHTEDYSYGCEWNISEHDLDFVKVTEKSLPWSNSNMDCMNINLGLDDRGIPRIEEVIKYEPFRTSFGMPGYEEQVAFRNKMMKMQAEICKRLESLDQEMAAIKEFEVDAWAKTY